MQISIKSKMQYLKEAEKEKAKKNKEKERLQYQIDELKHDNFKLEHMIKNDLNEKTDLVKRLMDQNRELESLVTLQKSKLDRFDSKQLIVKESFKEFVKRLSKFKSELEKMHLIE